jgi:hypothetical protein
MWAFRMQGAVPFAFPMCSSASVVIKLLTERNDGNARQGNDAKTTAIQSETISLLQTSFRHSVLCQRRKSIRYDT